jgi:hypothetical protein
MLAAAALGFVLASSKPPLDVNLTAFAQEPVAGIGQRSECDDPMPIGAFLFRTNVGISSQKLPITIILLTDMTPNLVVRLRHFPSSGRACCVLLSSPLGLSTCAVDFTPMLSATS